MQTGRIRWLAFREWQGINTRATRTTTKRWGPCRSSLQLQRGARVGGGIPQRAQGLATIWWLLRVVLMVVAQASSDYFAFRISCQLHSGQDTHLVSGVNQRQWKKPRWVLAYQLCQESGLRHPYHSDDTAQRESFFDRGYLRRGATVLWAVRQQSLGTAPNCVWGLSENPAKITSPGTYTLHRSQWIWDKEEVLDSQLHWEALAISMLVEQHKRKPYPW